MNSKPCGFVPILRIADRPKFARLCTRMFALRITAAAFASQPWKPVTGETLYRLARQARASLGGLASDARVGEGR